MSGVDNTNAALFVDLYELAVKRDEETSHMASEEATETDDFVIV